MLLHGEEIEQIKTEKDIIIYYLSRERTHARIPACVIIVYMISILYYLH